MNDLSPEQSTSYYTADAGDLVLCRSGDLWTVGISFARDETVEIEMTTDVARRVADFLLSVNPYCKAES